MSAVSSIGSALSNSANAKEQLALQEEAFSFVKEMTAENKALWAQELADFENNFGEIERTLSTYYNDLTADKAITSGMQDLAKSYSTAKSELNAELAQRGLSTSGAAAAAYSNLASQQAQAEAAVRKNAQEEVMAAKQNWYSTGLAQKSQALQGLSSAYNSAVSTGLNLANSYGSAASSYGKAASNSLASLGSSIGSIVGTGLKYGASSSSADSGSTSGSALNSNNAPTTSSLMNKNASYYDAKTNTIVDPDKAWYMSQWNGGN